jgi:hypothetical protein
MKKVLSFVLVLAMILGSVSMVFATEYVDDAAITNKEAVGVLSGLKVLEGDANGFRPNDTLTRAEAAAIIARLLLGRDDADKLTASAAMFSDVPATHWAAGYIAYCVSQGIIAGNGDGTFTPSGLLTVPAFGKMLLCALGYDATVEGLVGSNWEANTASLMVKAGVTSSQTGNCTRDNAAAMGLKALEADVVEYATKGTTVNIGGTIVSTGGSSATSVKYPAANSKNYKTGVADDNVQQLAEKVYEGDLTKASAGADEFGRPGNTWTLTKSVAGKYVGKIGTYGKKVAATFTSKMTAKEINETLGGYQYRIAGQLQNVDNTNKRVGATSISAIVNNAAPVPVVFATETAAEVIAAHTGDGKLVEVYATEGVINTIVEVVYRMDKVKSVDESKTKISYTLDTSGIVGVVYTDGTKDSDNIQISGSIAKGDYVTYVQPAGSTKTYVYPTTSVSGDQTAINATNDHTTVTLNGTNYTVGLGLPGVATPANDTDVTLYLDQYGFVVKSTGSENENYAYVISGFAKQGTDAIGKTTVTPSVKVVLMDGTVATYTIKTKTSGGWSVVDTNDTVYFPTDASKQLVQNNTVNTGAGITNINNLTGKIITYTMSDGNLKIDKVMNGAAGTTQGYNVDFVGGVTTAAVATEIKAGANVYTVTAVGDFIANGNTKFVVYNSDKDKASTYDGVSNMPKVTVTRTAVAMVGKSATGINNAKVVFYDLQKAVSAKKATYAYVKNTEVSSSKSGDDTVYSYTKSYDASGETITVTRKNEIITPAGVYQIDADNVYVDPYDDANFVKTDIAVVSDDTLKLSAAGTYFKITDSTKVVLVSSDVSKVDGNTVTIVLNEDESNHKDEILTIYVTAGTN